MRCIYCDNPNCHGGCVPTVSAAESMTKKSGTWEEVLRAWRGRDEFSKFDR